MGNVEWQQLHTHPKTVECLKDLPTSSYNYIYHTLCLWAQREVRNASHLYPMHWHFEEKDFSHPVNFDLIHSLTWPLFTIPDCSGHFDAKQMRHARIDTSLNTPIFYSAGLLSWYVWKVVKTKSTTPTYRPQLKTRCLCLTQTCFLKDYGYKGIFTLT